MAKNEVIETMNTGVIPADMLALVDDNAGMGIDTLSEEDKIIAQIRVAQSTSPQLKSKNAKYIPDLKLGDLFNSATGKVYGPSAKLAVLGVYKALIIWGTLDDVSSVPPEETVFEVADPVRYAEVYNACTVTEDFKRIYKGTKRVNTTYRIAAVIFNDDGSYEPIMIDCPKTRFKNAKQLITLLSNIKYTSRTGALKIAPSCLSLIKMEVIEAGNDTNEWYEYKFSRIMEDPMLKGGFLSAEVYQTLLGEAKLLKENLTSGKVKLDTDVDTDTETVSTVAETFDGVAEEVVF